MGFLRDIDIVQLVLPVKHHRISVDFIEILIDSISQFLLGFNPYTPEHLFGHFAEKPLHHIEPGALLRSEYKLESSRNGCKVFLGGL